MGGRGGGRGGREGWGGELDGGRGREGQGGAGGDNFATDRLRRALPEEGRFPAGTVLAGRYRILGLLGQGGMGEVYRAYDLILNQAVALKFLARKQMNEAALARFRNEVRIARQVSHPNVCRVYDIGFVEGLHFLSMEYLDGEDLASLLRRIGRLPQDKAIEFTRKICAGLAAAHERGVLHRDLKPANIMIDGRGQVRITDFGLAALAAEIPLAICAAARRPTCRRSRRRARKSPPAAIFIRWAWCCTKCSPASARKRSRSPARRTS